MKMTLNEEIELLRNGKWYDKIGETLLCDEYLNLGWAIRDVLDTLESLRMLQEEVQQMRWVPVEERLPEEGKRCLLYTPCDRILCVGYYAGKDERQHRHKWRLVTAMRSTQTLTKKVTHWMPLPKAPKEEKE